MHRATPSTSSSSSAAHQRSRKHRYTHQQLIKSLEILGPVSIPLPPALPSPPVSRSSSPAPSLKRKGSSHPDESFSKRPRTSFSAAEDSRRTPSSHPHPPPQRSTAHSMRSDPSEEGELREDSSSLALREASHSSSRFVPIRRPRRGERLNDSAYLESLHDKYHNMGRSFKYSSVMRNCSAVPPGSSSYRPLPNPPPVGSPYHKFAGIISKLEFVDSGLNFTFAIWTKDVMMQVYSNSQWDTLIPFLKHCHSRWEHPNDDRERAIVGMIEMLKAFICARKLWHYGKQLEVTTGSWWNRLESDYNKDWALNDAKRAAEPPGGATAPPPMLPSPASDSANSTPSNRANDVSPPQRSNDPQTTSNGSKPPLAKALPPHLSISVNSGQAYRLHQIATARAEAMSAYESAEQALSLPVLAKYFPRTYARVIHSTYGIQDELEPDFDDDEGELYWPGQLMNSHGHGLGWMCYLGRAMVRELGASYGYVGIDGVIQKPGVEGVSGHESGTSSSMPSVDRMQPPRPERPSGTGRVR